MARTRPTVSVTTVVYVASVVPSTRIPSNVLPATMLPAPVADPLMQCVANVLRTRETQSYEYRLNVNGQWRDYEARIVAGGKDEVFAMVREAAKPFWEA